MHLLRSVTPEEYWAKWRAFDDMATFIDLKPVDRNIAWREYTRDDDFTEWPIPISQFCSDPFYVGQEVVVRPIIAEFLADFWEPAGGYQIFVFVGGIGAGKSFSAALSLAYGIYQLSCLKRPAKYLSGFPGVQLSNDAEIVFMNASAAGAAQAGKIVYGETRERILKSPYFKTHFEPYSGRGSELDFPHRIRLSPGSSQWRTALGWNVYGFVVDEAAFGIESDRADYVKELFSALDMRRRSRFGQYGFGGLFTSPGSEYAFYEVMAGEGISASSVMTRRTTTWDAKDELRPGAPIFLMDRHPDVVRIVETDLIYVEPGVAQRKDGTIVRYENVAEPA